jgi:hypothetical protein
MKATVQSEYNHTEEVTERAEDKLTPTRLIRRGADRDLVQAKKTIETLLASWRWLQRIGIPCGNLSVRSPTFFELRRMMGSHGVSLSR